MIPPRSPFSLIQEDLWPDEWMILVSCMLLNQTTRKQMEKVLPSFKRRWPTPQKFLEADLSDVGNLIGCLGFARRRTVNLVKMTQAYVSGEWTHARELPGIGDYGGAAWEIFCKGKLPDECPKDGALMKYWHWRKKHS
jgi:methyl-CpG-binding domain protein 4